MDVLVLLTLVMASAAESTTCILHEESIHNSLHTPRNTRNRSVIHTQVGCKDESRWNFSTSQLHEVYLPGIFHFSNYYKIRSTILSILLRARTIMLWCTDLKGR